MRNRPDNDAMHAKSGLRVVLKWKIYRPDSVIAAVIRLKVKQDDKIENNKASCCCRLSNWDLRCGVFVLAIRKSALSVLSGSI